MMRWVRSLTLGMLALSLTASLARAAAFDPKQVPAAAKWVLHVDVDALKASSVGKLILQELQKKDEFQQTIQNIDFWTGLKLPEDLHDVTLYGKAFDSTAVVVLIRGIDTAVKDRTITLKIGTQFSSTKHGDHDVFSWQNKGRQLYGGIHRSTVLLFGRTPESINAALDLLDGKGDAMKADSPMASGAAAGTLVYVAGDGISELKQARNPLTNQAEAAHLALREQGDQLLLSAAVAAKTAQFAEQMRTSLEGIKAMVILAASNENADPKAKTAAAALQTLTAKSQDKTLTIECRISTSSIVTLLQNAQKDAGEPQTDKSEKLPDPAH